MLKKINRARLYCFRFLHCVRVLKNDRRGKDMTVKSAKIYSLVAIVVGFLCTLHVLHARLQKQQIDSVLILSSSSLDVLEEFHKKQSELVQLLQSEKAWSPELELVWAEAQKIYCDMLSHKSSSIFVDHILLSLIGKIKKLLLTTIDVPKELSKVLYCKAYEMLLLVQKRVGTVRIASYDKDLEYVITILNQLIQELEKGGSCVSLQILKLRVVSILQDIIYQCDGVCITDFDYVVACVSIIAMGLLYEL